MYMSIALYIHSQVDIGSEYIAIGVYVHSQVGMVMCGNAVYVHSQVGMVYIWTASNKCPLASGNGSVWQ